MKTFYVLVISIALTACQLGGRLPVSNYIEADEKQPRAKLRIITNGYVSGEVYEGCLRNPALMAKAGRVRKGAPNVGHLPVPYPPKLLNMPPRLAPSLPERSDGRQFSEGAYAELVAEYFVPSGGQFLLKSAEVSGMYSSRFISSCPSQQRLYQFKENENYEALIGMGSALGADGKNRVGCYFVVYSLGSDAEMYRRPMSPLPFVEPEQKRCP